MTHQPLIFAHRGAREAAPENTLPAFAKALAMGADGVELDVQCSRDDKLAVIHDFDVDKTTNGSGPVASYTMDELAALDAGSHFGAAHAGVGIPTLEQVFDLLQGQCQINVEIKSRDPQGGHEVELVAELIRSRNLYESVIVSSFNPITLIKMRWVDKRVRLGLLYFEPLPDYLRNAWLSPILAPEALHPYHELIDADYMQWAKSASYAVNTWTVNEVDEARRLANLGVDVIMTDGPDRIIAGLDI
ncbi:MAG: glycerophosphodiester phosphodiesterase family protein [Caldilineaceae bacterium]